MYPKPQNPVALQPGEPELAVRPIPEAFVRIQDRHGAIHDLVDVLEERLESVLSEKGTSDDIEAEPRPVLCRMEKALIEMAGYMGGIEDRLRSIVARLQL